MEEWPEMFWSEVGYYEPKSVMNLDKVENYVNEIEEEVE